MSIVSRYTGITNQQTINRKAFLTAIIAMITAPFVKAKKPDLLKDYERATFYNPEITDKEREYIDSMQVDVERLRTYWVSRGGSIRGYDLHLINSQYHERAAHIKPTIKGPFTIVIGPKKTMITGRGIDGVEYTYPAPMQQTK